eukprot:scaffold7214_cov114-Isochrysis_galbana.AAC.8
MKGGAGVGGFGSGTLCVRGRGAQEQVRPPVASRSLSFAPSSATAAAGPPAGRAPHGAAPRLSQGWPPRHRAPPLVPDRSSAYAARAAWPSAQGRPARSARSRAAGTRGAASPTQTQWSGSPRARSAASDMPGERCRWHQRARDHKMWGRRCRRPCRLSALDAHRYRSRAERGQCGRCGGAAAAGVPPVLGGARGGFEALEQAAGECPQRCRVVEACAIVALPAQAERTPHEPSLHLFRYEHTDSSSRQERSVSQSANEDFSLVKQEAGAAGLHACRYVHHTALQLPAMVALGARRIRARPIHVALAGA